MQNISYAQRYEDMHLLRAFGEQRRGFYIDIGAGHPVYDNVSFAFYLAGWRGISVEPNPALAALNRAVRKRDHLYEGLAGACCSHIAFKVVTGMVSARPRLPYARSAARAWASNMVDRP